MSPKFTQHGEKRANERGITPEQIDGLLASEKTLTVPSKYDDRAALAMGEVGKKLWVVVYNKETGEVVTARRAQKRERRLYEEKNGN
jgi:uncharacterized DUF497 family protein